MAPSRRMVPIVGLLLLIAGLLTACGGSSSSGRAQESPAGFPRTIDNCGKRITIEAPPERAASLDQGSTEILLSLGLADRMVGTAKWTDPVLKELEAANATVPRLADNAPSFERVLAEEPDFVSASFVSTMDKVSSRADFDKLGVPTYVSPADCIKNNQGDGDGSRAEPLRMRSIYGEIRDLARIFGVAERGEELIAELRGRLDAATKDIDASGVSMLYWFANSESPYMAGCCGAPGIITEAIGAKNVFDDTSKEWPQINWETVAGRNPDVLVLGDLTRKSQTAETAANKIEFLESHPVTRHMDAVRNRRYILLSGAAMNPSIRTVDGVEKVVEALREFGLVD
ncbi:iron complex transport system substrate-binding protein [Halopolyspora algeriensis]|uniref:Iron complex transport system substrate-binding protein n=1 Tax=Halopolyspora algeriensis TaxID=1500506 RepID=A0A368VTU1_9ACTN|nr:ABC transporter substrate-binding protein [Halopolyspora algeriensis]RCW45231.1 iron complex transport system substrate-binding protein [Halopolyspora algeriensis]TQM53050.1 iron complex transport system substrate-binding protein [Halopolyspora algeriensis]